jgi:acetyl-CoA synthetase
LKDILVVGENKTGHREKLFGEAIEESPATLQLVEMKSDDNLMLVYTGGTTGPPKGCVHKHCNVLRGPGHFALFNAEVRENDVFWNPADYAWYGPLFDLAVPVLFYGKAVVTYSAGGKFDPEKAFKLIEDYKITVAYIPPTGLRMMRQVENPAQKYNISSIRVIWSGAESFGKALPDWAAKTFGAQVVIHEGLGQTECGPITINCQRYFAYKYNIGKASMGMDVEIVDEQGRVLPPGQIGELACKAFDGNPEVLKEYWKDEAGTKAKFLNGWMLTGDLAVKDEEGYFTFVSRKDDVIISSGYRIGPSEIEDALIKHEAVLEAGVIGIPDETRGEIPKAFIVLRPGFEGSEKLKKELQEFVKDKLAKHEYMRAVQFMQELPKTTTGKIIRRELRKIEADQK